MFDTLIVQPVFNLLTLIYALIPGHDLGVAIIIFTIIIRILLWPIVKKQLHHAKAMRKLQPELKKIKKAAAGDRQKEARLQMELYKERDVKPFASIGTLIIQLPIFIALFQAVRKITSDPDSLINFSYGPIVDLPWMQHLSQDISKFNETFIGLVDLTRHGAEAGVGLYLPAVLLAVLSTIAQFYQTKLMMSNNQDARKLSVILKEAAAGKETDQAEVTAAISKLMLYFLPAMTFIFALIVPSALSLYLLTSSVVGYLQQKRVLDQDVEEMQEIADEPSAKKTVKSSKNKKTEAVVSTKSTTKKTTKKKTSAKPKGGNKKKRKK